MSEFTVGDADFLLDGRPVRLLSGALHYFRVHEAQWGHRLAMLRAMGLNCVETYVPWNLHEPRPGEFRDVEALGRFLDAAQPGGAVGDRAAGSVHLRRVGERRAAALADGARRRTRDDAVFCDLWSAGSRRLLPEVVSRQVDRGGPVIMVQVENEYGSYGSDAGYLRRLADLLRAAGVTVPLFTSDGPEDHMLDRRFGRRGARHGELRVPRARGLRDAAPAPRRRAADVHGVLVRLVRPLGR